MRVTVGDGSPSFPNDYRSITAGVSDTDQSAAVAVPDEKTWEELAKNTLRAEMMRRGVSYAALAERLALFGITDNELNLRNKVSRGRFTAVFLMQCLKALEVEWIHIPTSLEDAARPGGAHAMASGPRRPSS